MYTKALETGWKPKAKYRVMSEEAHQLFRDKFHIICEGHNLPPPIPNFPDMKFPPSILKHLEGKGIKRPTPIQLQVRLQVANPPDFDTGMPNFWLMPCPAAHILSDGGVHSPLWHCFVMLKSIIAGFRR